MKEVNNELDGALHIVINFIEAAGCDNCPSKCECKVLNYMESEDSCIISNAFDIIHQEILRIKD